MAKPGTQVFISYCRDDYDQVLQIHKALLAYEIPTWMDSGIVGGAFWETEIRKAISESRYFVLCLSKALSDRQETYVANEMNWIFEKSRNAKQYSPTIFPVLLNCETTPSVSGFRHTDVLTQIQHISITKGWGDGIAKLLSAIDPNSGRVNTLSNELDASSARRRIFAARQLGDLGFLANPAIPRLRQLLADKNITVRANAAVAVGAIGDTSDQTLDALIEGIEDSDTDWGYGYPVLLSTMNKLVSTNSQILTSLIHKIEQYLNATNKPNAHAKLELAKMRLESWAEQRIGQPRKSDQTRCDQLSLALSNSPYSYAMEIERFHDEELLIRIGGVTETLFGASWSYHDDTFTLFSFESGQPQRYGKVDGLKHVVSVIEKFIERHLGIN